MNKLNLVLIFYLLSFCFSQSTDDQCETKFLSILQDKCQSFAGTLNTFDKKCIPTNECSGKTLDTCQKNIPVEFHTKKCSFVNNICKKVDKVCSDFNAAVNGVNITGDTCSDLAKVEGEGDRCYYSLIDISDSTENRECKTHYDSCSSIDGLTAGDKENICKKNIPKDLTKKCEWDSKTSKCNEVQRNCDEYQYLYNWASKDTCKKLKASSTTSVCTYNEDNNSCEEAFPCEHWNNDQSTCDLKTPINEEKNGFDYLYRCKYDSSIKTGNKCHKVLKKCGEYDTFIHGDALCSQFEAEDPNMKKCVLKGNCIEQYKDCQIYDENEKEKSRENCESLILDEENKKCVYIKKENKCLEDNIYYDCNEYKGTDKRICENILSPKRNSHCVLDKDSECEEREFYCSEAYDKYDCLIYAKPTDKTKKCVWDGSNCKEQYKGCEDFVKKRFDSQTTCDALEVYNGKKCVYESTKCISIDKTCAQAKSEEECQLIEKTGVSDPERKYCEWDSGKCVENYKYCSDYRQTKETSYTTYQNKCKKIKPFNPKTNTLDLAYTCDIIDGKVGCEKVPKECSAAGANKIICDLISPLIKDNRIKYCAFVNGGCVEHYKTCALIDNEIITNKGNSICTGNIPQGEYFSGTCETYTDSSDGGKTKCKESSQKCDAFNTNINTLEWLCSTINPNCGYSDGSCRTVVKSCGEIKFFKSSDDNKEICEEYTPDDAHKVCVLNEDKSGCKEVYRESIPFIYANNINQDNNFL